MRVLYIYGLEQIQNENQGRSKDEKVSARLANQLQK